MAIYYVEAAYGCGIRQYDTDQEALDESLLDMGRDNFVSVRQASIDDINHVKQMGGWVPPEADQVIMVHEQLTEGGDVQAEMEGP
jgi:hypothetical protein